MIGDPELARLFRMESTEHLTRLDQGLLRLEKTPGDRGLLEELFRAIHSLKGGARMLGLAAIEGSAHEMEGVLDAARRTEAPLEPTAIDALNAGLGKLRQLVDRVLAARPDDDRQAAAAAPAPPQADLAAAGDRAPPQPAPAPVAPPAQGEPFRIETVRVETSQLDELLTLAGELGVLEGRARHRLALMNAVVDQWTQAGNAPRHARLDGLLREARDSLHEDAARFESTLAALQDRIYGVRLLPLGTVFGLFPRMVRDLAREQDKQAELLLAGEDITVDKRILEGIKDPLTHLLRNAVGHGIEPVADRERLGKPRTGCIRLAARREGDHVVIEVQDDGRGLDLDSIRRTARKRGLHGDEALAAMTDEQLQQLVLVSGFSTATFVTELAGRGVGLDVVRTNVEQLKGSIRIGSRAGQGAAVALRLPLSLTTVRLLLVQVAGVPFGLPMECVRAIRRLRPEQRLTLEGLPAIEAGGGPLLAPQLADLLDLPCAGQPADATPAPVHVVIEAGSERLAVQVDDCLNEEEVVPRPLGPPLTRVRNVSGLATLASGEVCPLLNPADLLRSASRLAATPRADSGAEPVATPARGGTQAILLVEDSALVRAMEKRILDDAGYEVVAAVDGADALGKLGSQAFAAVVSDIQMPNLDGLSLTARIRQEARYKDLPVVLVTALASDEDKRRGLEVGANAYIPKPSFDQRMLLDTLRRLIGP